MKDLPVDKARIVPVPVVEDPRGCLSFIQSEGHAAVLPFGIGSVAWTCGLSGVCCLPPESTGGSMLVALAGSFMATIDSGNGFSESSCLARPDRGLLMPAGSRYTLDINSDSTVIMRLGRSAEAAQTHDSCSLISDGHGINTLGDCRIVDLPVVSSASGNSVTVENGPDSPVGFDVRRVYYLFDVPEGAERGGHSHRCQAAFLTAVSGSFDVVLEDGAERRGFRLDSPARGLLIPPGIWRELEAFTEGAVCLSLSPSPFSEEDYVRDYDEFKSLSAKKI